MSIVDLILADAAASLKPPHVQPPALTLPLPPSPLDGWHDIAFAGFCFNVAEFFGLDCRDVLSLVAASPEYLLPDRPCTAPRLARLGNIIAEALDAAPQRTPFTIALH